MQNLLVLVKHLPDQQLSDLIEKGLNINLLSTKKDKIRDISGSKIYKGNLLCVEDISDKWEFLIKKGLNVDLMTKYGMNKALLHIKKKENRLFIIKNITKKSQLS